MNRSSIHELLNDAKDTSRTRKEINQTLLRQDISNTIKSFSNFILGNRNIISQYDVENLEFEIRLGQKMQGTFNPSLKYEMRQKLIERLKMDNWNMMNNNTIDYFYDTKEGSRRISVDKETKEILEDIYKGNFSIHDDFESPELKHTLRCNIKSEEKKEINDNTIPTGYNFIREKQRMTFTKEELWWIDLTTVISQHSNQTQSLPNYEVSFFVFFHI